MYRGQENCPLPSPLSPSRLIHSNTEDKNLIKKTRPTYGAYTMPRGPYLQYKYNDRQSTVNTVNKNHLEHNDNNHQHQQQQQHQKRQIEKLKNEFIHLPRARICSNGMALGGGSALPSSSAVDNYHSTAWGNGLIQTLGRYKHQHKQQYPQQQYHHQNGRGDGAQGISNFEYFLDGQIIQSNNELNRYGKKDRITDFQNRQNANHASKYDDFLTLNSHRIYAKQYANGADDDEQQQQQYYHREKHCSTDDGNDDDNNDAVDIDADTKSYKRIDANGNDFLQHLQTKNLHLLSNLNSLNTRATGILAKSSSSNYINVNGNSNNNNNDMNSHLRATSCTAGDNIINTPINYVTLAEVVKIKAAGLNQTEGWALLCQSVQALQDLFLSGE